MLIDNQWKLRRYDGGDEWDVTARGIILDPITRYIPNMSNGLEIIINNQRKSCPFKLMRTIVRLRKPLNQLALDLDEMFGFNTIGEKTINNFIYASRRLAHQFMKNEYYRNRQKNAFFLEELAGLERQFVRSNQGRTHTEEDYNNFTNKAYDKFNELLIGFNGIINIINGNDVLLILYNSLVKDHANIGAESGITTIDLLKQFIHRNDGKFKPDYTKIPYITFEINFNNPDVDSERDALISWIAHVISSAGITLKLTIATTIPNNNNEMAMLYKHDNRSRWSLNYYDLFFGENSNQGLTRQYIDQYKKDIPKRYTAIPVMEIIVFCHDLLKCIKADLLSFASYPSFDDSKQVSDSGATKFIDTSNLRPVLKQKANELSQYTTTMKILLNNLKNGSFVLTSSLRNACPTGFLKINYDTGNYYEENIKRLHPYSFYEKIATQWTPMLTQNFPEHYKKYFEMIESRDGEMIQLLEYLENNKDNENALGKIGRNNNDSRSNDDDDTGNDSNESDATTREDDENSDDNMADNQYINNGNSSNQSNYPNDNDRMDLSKKICSSCKKPRPQFKCGGKMCKNQYYCNIDCQIRDWKNHKCTEKKGNHNQ